MESILDEQLDYKEEEKVKPIPLILYFLMVAIFIYFLNILFAIQSCPYASELLSLSIVGGSLGIILKFIQERKLEKEQEETTEE